MALLSGSFNTYEALGDREDLTDVITNISPVDTWFTSNSGEAKAKGRYHEWQTDSLAAAAANAQYEGDDSPAATAATPTVRDGNYCQILRKVFAVTETQETVDKAGRESEIAYQTEKNLKELAKDIEYALIINASAASGATGTARTMKGVIGFIVTNTTSATATGLDITETILNNNLQLVWAEGGDPKTLLVGGYNKRKISAFTTNTRETKAENKTLTAAVDVYKSDFGELSIRLHRTINASSAGTILVLGDMGLWKKAWLRKTKKVPLAKTGDNEKYMIVTELTLEARQEKGSGRIFATKSS